MKKKITLALSVLCILALVIALASCGAHEHSADSSWKNDDTNHWNVCVADDGTCTEKLNSAAHTFEKDTVDATCTKTGLITETCTVCGYEKETEIPVLAHDYNEATCTLPKSCKVCGIVEGEALGHSGGTATCEAQAICERCNQPYGDWGDHVGGKATCRSKAVCSVCRASYGELGDHDFADATCLAPKTCRHCGETEGDIVDHVGGAPTCTEPAKCDVCGQAYGEALGHKGGTATCTEAAICEVCNEPYGDFKHQGGTATCTERAVCEICSEPYGNTLSHNSDGGKCTVCGSSLNIVGLDGIEKIEASHEGDGAANVEKLFDGSKTSTGIYTIGDSEYSPLAVGDILTITLKEEIFMNEMVVWETGNWSNADVFFYDADGNETGKVGVTFNNILEGSGDSVAKTLKLAQASRVKTIKIVYTYLKWDSGKTAKISEIEIFVGACVSNHAMTEGDEENASYCALCGYTEE
ncbi:MAG: hypothetical protein E7596_06280 [Ruminococcaceae bacterium]|nr:hypothetical protein [Oscillospiraceae bacterium]